VLEEIGAISGLSRAKNINIFVSATDGEKSNKKAACAAFII
jgi:hypothetical protein